MAKTGDKDKAALLVIDVQKGVMADCWEADRVIENVSKLVEYARQSEVPVVWIQHEAEDLPRDSEQWQMVDALQPGEGEARVYKTFSDSFADTELGQLLEERGIGHVVVSGAQTNACIRNTTYGAINRGYDVTLVEDAHTTQSFEMEGVNLDAQAIVMDANLGLYFNDWPGQEVGTATTETVLGW